MSIIKLLSYLWPFRLKKYESTINGHLEVNLVNGQKVLDSNESNYSYGSLQKILKEGLIRINFDKSIKSLLVLGLGAGSIVETIRQDFRSDAFIELVDIDEMMIGIASNEFQINRFDNIKMIHADASDFVFNTSSFYDLIIVDIFIGDTIPEKFMHADFIKQLVLHLNKKGKVIFNTMQKTMPTKRLDEIKESFEKEEMTVSILPNVEWSNDLILARR